jgi:antitoxin component YwqK of YwqJK toxin-antitoxin module
MMIKKNNFANFLSICFLCITISSIFSCNQPTQTKTETENQIIDTLENIYTKRIIKTHPGGEKAIVHYFDTTANNQLVYEIKYYPNGAKEMEGAYKNNVRVGKWIAWYDTGVIWSTGYYTNGLRDGASAVYFPNGQIRYEKNYKNDTAEGSWMFYNEEGNPIGRAIYEKGVLVGEDSF